MARSYQRKQQAASSAHYCTISFCFPLPLISLLSNINTKHKSMDRFMLEAKVGRKIPPKTILVVRHGQSEHNAHIYAQQGADNNDERYIDAPLTQRGVYQAQSIRDNVSSFKPQLIVTSPMTRAIQTGLLATGNNEQALPFAITPLCSERMAYSCDIGSPVSTLKQRFPYLDFSQVPSPELWWWTREETDEKVVKSAQRTLQLIRRTHSGYDTGNDGVEPYNTFMQRVADFRTWLLLRPEQRIVVFAHGVFLYSFVGEQGQGFRNCEMRKITL